MTTATATESGLVCPCGRKVPLALAFQARMNRHGVGPCGVCGTRITLKAIELVLDRKPKKVRDGAAKRIARADGPATSAEGAAEVQKKINEEQERALKFVRENPDKTAMELAKIAGDTDTRRIGKRLPEIEWLGQIRRGEVRKCEVTKHKAATWRAVDPMV